MNRKQFLKTGLISMLLGLFPFNIFSNEKVFIKKNPLITFTPEILSQYNVGLYIINDKADVTKNLGYANTVTWKLVWQFERQRNNGTPINGLPKYGLCNALTDGWTYWIANSKEELCSYLNDNPYGDKYRILTPEELIYIVKHRSNQKQIVRHI